MNLELPATSLEDLLKGLDEEQRAVVTAIRGPVCVMAGAGTGKTRTITHRLAYAIGAGVTDASKTLSLTFTAKAAGEMRVRLRNLGINNATARTFHSAALRQLAYFWGESFGGQFPKLLTSKSSALVDAISRTDIRLAPRQNNLRDISGEIEWAKVNEFAPDQYVQGALATGRGRSKNILEEVSKIYQSYEDLKRQERVIDFEDVLLLTVGMLEEDRNVRERVRDQYRYFTIDEYQDVSPLQQRLLNLWLGNREDICVVGDASQTIYSFAGATSAFLLNFPKRFSNAQVFYLTRGYRSTPEIIRSANNILRSAGAFDVATPELASANASGAKPEIKNYPTVKDEIIEVSETISEFATSSGDLRSLSDIAILARTNAQLEGFESELNSRGIPTQLKASEKFFDRIEVKEAIREIRSASVIPSGNDWYQDLIAILRPFGEADYVKALRHLAEDLKAEGAKSLRQLLRELEDRAEQNNPPTLPGVVLATLHAAKGLEWDQVFLVGASANYLPLQLGGGSSLAGELETDIEEERRLFYVGLTRAKRRIQISYSGSASPFLSAIN
jgi:DNA helicase II / ATP-dependent DNA helicase PcrA